MSSIKLLSQDTIDKIAAGEVVERPSSVVKELIENAMDAGATAITAEIKEGGISFIRITDNGSGIAHDEIGTAFLRHSTSKISSVEDLLSVRSLGFRGEALSSIAAVSRVEIITKISEELMGSRYVIEGSKELAFEDVGAPDGTTFLVKDLFYNTPARRKFLKTTHTEGSYVADLVEKLALSHPDISFKFINNNQTKLHTSGNGNTKDLIYHIYGRDIAASLIEVDYQCGLFSVTGFIGKPVVTRGNRNYENYFINGRYVKSSLIARAIEEAYKNFIMQHQYPFTVLYFTFDSALLDVNVHPSKMELRFERQQEIYQALVDALFALLSKRDIIPRVPVTEEKTKGSVREWKEPVPEPFEKRRINDVCAVPQPPVSQHDVDALASAQKNPADTGKDASGLAPKNPTGTDMGKNGTVSYTQNDSPFPQSPRKFAPGVSEDTLAYKASRSRNNTDTSTAQRSDASTGDFAASTGGSPGFTDAGSSHSGIQYGSAPNYPSGTHRAVGVQNLPEELLGVPRDLQTVSQSSELQNRTPQDSGLQNPTDKLDGLSYEEVTLGSLSSDFMSQQARKKHRIIGQLFDTYWLVEYEQQLYIIDQHAAHEKVLYERMMARLSEKEFTSQMISPPIILSLDAREEEMLEAHREQIERFGYEVEPFGGREYMISAVPDNLYQIDMKDLFIEMLDDFANMSGKETPQLILEKVASMSCKAAVKGNNRLSFQEADALIAELLTLDNPYNCPHGRPTIIAMTKYELEKKFKRIV